MILKGFKERDLFKLSREARKDGFTLLHVAAEDGKLDLVKKMVQRGTYKLEVRDTEWGNTPLFRAVSSGHDAVVKFLLDSKANPNTANNKDVSAIYQAAGLGRLSIVKLLAGANANIESASPTSGQTPLHGACLNDQLECIKLLLELKADPNKVAKNGIHALFMATERGSILAIELLVKWKADVNVTRPDGTTALMQAAFKGQSEAVKTLVGLGASVEVLGRGQTAAGWATAQGHNEVAQYLLTEMSRQQQQQQQQQQKQAKKSQNQQKRKKDKQSAPKQEEEQEHEKAKEKDKEKHNNPEINLAAVDPEGFTFLHRAAEAGNSQLINHLIDLKANIEAKDATWQETPLFRAVLAGKPHAVDALLQARAQVDSPNKDGVSPLYQACAMGTHETIDVLIKAGANIEHKSSFDQTPLHAASLNGQTNAVELLMRHNVDMEAITTTKVGALHMAAERGHVDIINILVSAGANVNLLGPYGITPLMQAAYKNQPLAVETLLQLKADASIEAMGKTAIQWAEQQGNTQVIALLKKLCLHIQLLSVSDQSDLEESPHNINFQQAEDEDQQYPLSPPSLIEENGAIYFERRD